MQTFLYLFVYVPFFQNYLVRLNYYFIIVCAWMCVYVYVCAHWCCGACHDVRGQDGRAGSPCITQGSPAWFEGTLPLSHLTNPSLFKFWETALAKVVCACSSGYSGYREKKVPWTQEFLMSWVTERTHIFLLS